MSIPRHHHYLSECYLKGFCVPRKKGFLVQVFDRIERKYFPTNPRNIAGERDFNRLNDDQGEDPFALEKAYAKFEDKLGPAIQRVAEAAAFPSDDDRELIISMIALFALRNPRWRERVRTLHEEIAKKILSVSLATKERWDGEMARAKRDGLKFEKKVDFEEMRAFVKSDDFKLNLDRGYHIGTELKSFETVLPLLAERKWWFMRAPKTSGGFISGDHPVALMWSDPKMRDGFYSPGHGLERTQVTFPLTSRVAMVGAFEIKERADEVSELTVAQINGTTIGFCDRQVFARDFNFHYVLDGPNNVRKASRLIDDPHFLRSDRPKK